MTGWVMKATQIGGGDLSDVSGIYQVSGAVEDQMTWKSMYENGTLRVPVIALLKFRLWRNILTRVFEAFIACSVLSQSGVRSELCV